MEEMESKLRPPEVPLKPYPPKAITLLSGEKMVARECRRDEADLLLQAIKDLISAERDYYDVVAARVFAEITAWKRHRIGGFFAIAGVVDGELLGLVTSRAMDEKRGSSLHTIAIKRGKRVGAHLFAAKMEHHVEILEEDEVYIVAESPIGFGRFVVEWNLEPSSIPHELGGANSWILTRKNYLAAKPRLVFGERPVPEELLQSSYNLKLIVPDVLK